MAPKSSLSIVKISSLEFFSVIGEYWTLLKPRVISLVVFTGVVGLLLAPGSISLLAAFTAIICIAGGSGAAGALNMWYERDLDALMDRTKNRPLPQGKILPQNALRFGATLALVSVLGMYTFVNFWAAFYLLSAILFYVLVYTVWLKRRTPQNIVIGGIAGALPPVIGWACVMNKTSLFPWILCGIIFLWTPPHFWALALFRQEDYEKTPIPMLPIISGPETTKNQIIFYSMVLFLLTLLPAYRGDLGIFYGGVAFLLGILFLGLALKVKFSNEKKYSWILFLYSIFYLFTLFLSMLIDRLSIYENL